MINTRIVRNNFSARKCQRDLPKFSQPFTSFNERFNDEPFTPTKGLKTERRRWWCKVALEGPFAHTIVSSRNVETGRGDLKNWKRWISVLRANQSIERWLGQKSCEIENNNNKTIEGAVHFVNFLGVRVSPRICGICITTCIRYPNCDAVVLMRIRICLPTLQMPERRKYQFWAKG